MEIHDRKIIRIKVLVTRPIKDKKDKEYNIHKHINDQLGDLRRFE